MQHPFNDESPNRGPLADLVSQIVDVDARRRALDAQRDVLLAKAYQLAESEGLRAVGLEPDSIEKQLADRAQLAGVGTSAKSTAEGLPRGAVVRRDRAHRMVRAEIASALHVPESHISRDIAHAVDAVEWCPKLHRAQAAGQITAQHVHTVIDAGRIILHRAAARVGGTLVDADGVPLSEEEADREMARRYALYETAVLPYSLTHTAPLLAPVAKRLAEKVAGVTFDDRHEVAKQDRRVWLTDLEDGMCNLTAHLTSVEAHAVFDQLTQYGKRLQQADVSAAGIPQSAEAAGNPASEAASEAMKRPLPEARADSLVTLLLEGQVPETGGIQPRVGPRVAARVQVLVPVSLTGRLGKTPEPGADDAWFQPELVGVGPIHTDTAQHIARDTPTWDIVIVDDGTGAPAFPSNADIDSDFDTMGDVLSVEGYRVPAKLRQLLAARDQHCRFPGCSLPVHRCDIDHTIAAEDGGPTATNNLGNFCRGHHVLKHHGSCLVEQKPRGVYEWTYPSGRVYREPPPSKVAFTSALGPPDLQQAQQRIRGSIWRDAPDDCAKDPPGSCPQEHPPPW